MTEIIGKKFAIPYDSEEQRKKMAFNGKILRVNLSTGEMKAEEPGEAFYRKYIGGRGFILHYLLSELPAGTDPLSPENLLIFAPGIMTGTTMPSTGRHAVGAKSPLTGALASGEAGGYWGVELKKTGFDAIVIQGKAENPVYLWIRDGVVEIRDARHLWGKVTGEAEDLIRDELGDEKVQVSLIGPGGENQVLYACVLNNTSRAAGRSGLGAVMGSKNLKAVAVRGRKTPGLADKKLLGEVTKWVTKSYKDLMGWAVETGTLGSVKFQHDTGTLPIRNYKGTSIEGIENIDAAVLFPLMLKGKETCAACPVKCKPVFGYKDEKVEIDPRYGGPEYETLGALGSVCAVTDSIAVAKAAELCEQYGLDTISTGGTIAFTMECVEKGLLTAEQGYDFLPKFGDPDSLVKSVHAIAMREGIGALMALGSARMAGTFAEDVSEMVVTVRGQEPPVHDARRKNLYGMGYALSATGADHMHNMDDTFANFAQSDVCGRLAEAGIQVPLPLYGITEEKIRGFIVETAYKNYLDSAVICHFYPFSFAHVAKALQGATGWDVSQGEIIEIGNRIIHMSRLFLVREGFTTEDDKLPERFHEPHSEGPIAGKGLTREELRQSIERYYELMGWGPDGIPAEPVVKKYEIEMYV